MHMKTLIRLIPVLIAALAGALIAVVIDGGSNKTTSTTVIQSNSGLPASLNEPRGMTINRVYRQDGAGVVDITVTAQSNSPSFGFFGGGSQQTEGEGAGVVYDRKGDILTDEHVVAGATSVRVTFENGYKAGARVLGTDPSTDVAVIKVGAPASQLHPIPFADSSA